ncbi:hypothetical protein Tco_0138142 [Tanacetum coccineum]
MDTTRAQQQALDDELVAPADRLKIGKSNLRLSSILKSKEPTLQVALDALKLTPFYNAFEISADVPEIYMQEFWVTVSRHHSSLRFKLNGKSHTVNVDNFKDMLKICPKLHDLVYEVENKNSKKNNDMYYPRFTKVIVDYFMAKDQAIPRRNKMFWHYARDDFIFTTIKVISKHQDIQVYGVILPRHLTNQAMLESKAYMTYHAYVTGEKTPKPKSIKKKADSKSSPKTKLTQASKGKRIKTIAKGDKPAKKNKEEDDDEVNVSKDNADDADNDDDVDNDDEDDDADNQDDEIPDDANQDDDDEKNDSDNDGDDFVHPRLSTHDDEVIQYDEVNEDESNEESDDESNKDSDEEVQGANLEEEEMDEEATHRKDEANELYMDVMEDTHVIIIAPINPEGQQQSSFVSSGFVSNMLNPSPDTCIDIIFTPNTEATSLIDVQVTTIAEPPLLSTTTLPPTPLITHLQQTPVPTPLQFERLRDEAQAENADFLNKLDDNIKKIIKDQVKEQVKAQVSKIFPKIKKTVNEQLEAKVMTCSSTKSKTSLAIAANLSELELKKTLIDKMESNKSIYRSDEQKNIYKALVDAYESDKLILNTYGDTVSFKRHRDDEDKDEEYFAGSNQGSKKR